MDTVFIILRQTALMFIYMAIGFLLFKKNLITKEGSKSMAHLLLYCILPCIVVKSFYKGRTAENELGLLISVGLAILILLASMAVSMAIFRKRPIDNFGAAFSNAGFMGFPLIITTLGSDAVFYAAGFVAILNALQWTYGQALLTGDWKNCSFGAVVKNPLVLSLTIGIALFFAQFKLPSIIVDTIKNVSALNAPVAMIILGVYLAQTDMASIFVDKYLYVVSVVRLLILPVLTIFILKPFVAEHETICMTLLLASCAPIGSNVAVYAQKLDKDYPYAVKTVCLSTLLSIITMPIVVALAQIVW